MSEEILQIISALEELQSDNTLPKSVKAKIDEAIDVLTKHGDDPIKINKAISELSELSESVNMQSHIRMQLFNVMSLLETV